MIKLFKTWLVNEDANAAIEAVMVFPILIAMMFGIIDIGKGIIVNKKVITASHMVSDLLSRDDTVSDSALNDAIVAGELALGPYDTASFGIDIVGIQFIGGSAEPTEIWRDTVNMSENGNAVTGAASLGDEDEGVLAITVEYTYKPPFSSLITGDILMQEVSYVRGRASSFVSRE